MNYSSIRYLFDASTVSTFDEDELSIFEKNYEVSPEPDHIYGSPSYEWSETDSGYSCTATVVCEECDEDTEGHSITETVQATYALTKTATCDEAGEETYTAEFADDLFDTQEKVVAVPAIGHDWTFTDFTWTKKAGGGYDVTANYDCNNDASHKQSVAAVVEAKTEDATCTEAGSITYTATVSKADSPDQSEHTDSKTVTGEALGHDWGAPTYTWSTDYSSVTARRVCKNDSTHVETETVNTTSEVTKAATCDSEGVTTYTAVFENSAFAKQTKSVTDIPATGHSWNTAYTVDKEATDTEDGQESIHCSVCGEIKEGSERVIPKTDQPVVEKSGWIKENGYWYYYENNERVTNEWKKDSKGWCYLDADGKMVTNGWAKDGKGWCWIASDGYMPTTTGWIKYNGGWYHITKGYRDETKWMKDSKGWCYLGSDGKMVINDWAKDSKGWCWMGSDGYWVSNKWVKSGGQWYYIKSNHYMAADEWAKDSGGWMYMDANGKITRNKWIQSGGYWYYLKSNGYMATGTLTISGKTYKFDSSGRWVS